MNQNNNTQIDGALSAAVGILAERLDRLTGAVERLTTCLATLPQEYGPPPPPYPIHVSSNPNL
jgi:hypothetical protein